MDGSMKPVYIVLALAAVLVGGLFVALVVTKQDNGAPKAIAISNPSTLCRDSAGNTGPCDHDANCGTPTWDYANAITTVTTPFTISNSNTSYVTTDLATIVPLTNTVPDVTFTIPATTFTYQTTTNGPTLTATNPAYPVTTPPCDIDSQPRKDANPNPPSGCAPQQFQPGADQVYAAGCEPLGVIDTTGQQPPTTTFTTTTVPTLPTTTAPVWACDPRETLFSSEWQQSIYHGTYAAAWATEDAALKLYEQNGAVVPAPASHMGKAWLAAIGLGCK
jgi:hypothetical protein